MQPRILIVDDDPDIVETTKVVLESEDYSIDSAANGSEAMKKIEINKPDLIILDVMMDTLREGFLLSRELKKNPDYKDIPILMITSVKEKTGIDFKPAAGVETWLPVQDFLEKPVKPAVLLEKVDALLKKQ